MMSPISKQQSQTNDVTYFNKPITSKCYLLFKKNNYFTYLNKKITNIVSPISKNQSQPNDVSYFKKPITNK